ncbi:phosphate ABC transporter substrate-binding protein [Psychrosphaera aestuarii]|uniref:phosphate ABC transporter substrate-binding protein n=1 Tax=Psychrosphaera aestuarii TaxID=1266052 RepID=UPI001B342E85|nr:phosphate ABC transporter substrate-binding protein [Psychrosphaera aestuarii]
MKIKQLVVSFIFCFSCTSIAGNVVVINAENTAKISTSDIKKLYLGKKGAFSNGKKATLATLLAGNSIRESFNIQVLNKNESQYTGYWAKLSFTGRGIAPVEFTSSQEVKRFVSSRPNAMGIIDDKYLDSSLKVVLKF